MDRRIFGFGSKKRVSWVDLRQLCLRWNAGGGGLVSGFLIKCLNHGLKRIERITRGGREKAGRWIRRGWVSQPIGRGNPAPTRGGHIGASGDSILPLAPEGRHVYRRAGYTNILKPQRGDMWERDTGKAIREYTPIYTNQNKI